MINKKRLKITVDHIRSGVTTIGDLKKNRASYLTHMCGGLYLYGISQGIVAGRRESRDAFIRQRDYDRYRNGYNNGVHLQRYV
jgi:hypothetical protein